MKLRPLHDHVLVRLSSPEDKTPGGIHIPSTAQNKGDRAEVLAVGHGVYSRDGKLIPLDVRAGDVVLLNRNSERTEFNLDGEKVHVVKYAAVMAVVT